MKKGKIVMIILFCLVIVLVLFLLFFNKKSISFSSSVNVVPTLDDKVSSNTSWCSTFQLVWNDMKNEVVKQDIVFTPQIEMVKNLNKESFNESMISDSYYYKTYGPKTIKLKNEIEKAIKDKFNQESDILDSIDWSDDALTSDNVERYFFYTMLYREFQYNTKFSILDKSSFGEYKNIKYFGVNSKSNSEVFNQIKVLFYNSSDDFAVKLITKDNDEVIFYKNPTGETFNEIYNNMMSKTKAYNGDKNFNDVDSFKAPMIDFNIKKEFYELENKEFKTYNGTAIIEKAIQTISFSLDEKGGRIKSEAAADIMKMSIVEDEVRHFDVDSTFALFLKEKERDVPYFALLVDDITKFQK